jgi:alpha(1,3/1,4) fucosyltransferase
MIKIGLFPWTNELLNNRIFEIKNMYNLFGYDCLYKNTNPFKLLKEILGEEKYELTTIDLALLEHEKTKYFIFFDVPDHKNFFYEKCIKLNLNEKMILFLWEPSAVKPKNFVTKFHKNFKYIFTWRDDFVDNIRYFKFNYPQPTKFNNPYEKKFEEKKFCTLIAGNKTSNHMNELYSKRLKTIQFYEKNLSFDFDFYGRGWKKQNVFFSFLKLKRFYNYKNYKGEVDNKLKCLSEYKYCICYENQKLLNGYITEKIFDCFFSGTVPVYWGAENITEYIPKSCFIDRRDFKNNFELNNYLESITKNRYLEYIKSINNFLDSDSYLHFSDYYVMKKISNFIVKGEYNDYN